MQKLIAPKRTCSSFVLPQGVEYQCVPHFSDLFSKMYNLALDVLGMECDKIGEGWGGKKKKKLM